MTRLYAVLLAVLTMFGCAPTLKVTYHSDPEGAMLYANNAAKLFGYTPFTLKYTPPKSFLEGKACWRVEQSMVRWASGAEASIPALEVCPTNGRNQQFVFQRPTGLPGREADAQFAAQLQANAALVRQAQALEESSVWQLYALLNEQNRAYQRSLSCTSRVVGQTVYTDCR